MLSPFINRKWFYNFASMISILCGVIFFAYPGAGFLNKYIQFENIYSIVTHSVFFIGSFLLLTLKFVDFNYKNIKKELISLATLIFYCILEMFVLTKNSNGDPLEYDPFIMMPNNDVQDILGLKNYPLYLVLYCLFIIIYLSSYYLINIKRINKRDN
jgi:hypothetical protein